MQRLRLWVIGVVTSAWAVSFGVSQLLPARQIPAELNGMMLLVVGLAVAAGKRGDDHS